MSSGTVFLRGKLKRRYTQQAGKPALKEENYIGVISLIKYKSQPVVYTNFGLGSGEIAFYLFGCNGNLVNCDADDEVGEIPDLARGNIIYTSLKQ